MIAEPRVIETNGDQATAYFKRLLNKWYGGDIPAGIDFSLDGLEIDPEQIGLTEILEFSTEIDALLTNLGNVEVLTPEEDSNHFAFEAHPHTSALSTVNSDTDITLDQLSQDNFKGKRFIEAARAVVDPADYYRFFDLVSKLFMVDSTDSAYSFIDVRNLKVKEA